MRTIVRNVLHSKGGHRVCEWFWLFPESDRIFPVVQGPLTLDSYVNVYGHGTLSVWGR
jgi:hypothetical protein